MKEIDLSAERAQLVNALRHLASDDISIRCQLERTLVGRLATHLDRDLGPAYLTLIEASVSSDGGRKYQGGRQRYLDLSVVRLDKETDQHPLVVEVKRSYRFGNADELPGEVDADDERHVAELVANSRFQLGACVNVSRNVEEIEVRWYYRQGSCLPGLQLLGRGLLQVDSSPICWDHEVIETT